MIPIGLTLLGLFQLEPKPMVYRLDSINLEKSIIRVEANKPADYLNLTYNEQTKIHWRIPASQPLNPSVKRPKEYQIAKEGDHTLTIDQLNRYNVNKRDIYLRIDFVDTTAKDIEIFGINFKPK